MRNFRLRIGFGLARIANPRQRGVFTSFAVGTGWKVSGSGSIGYKITYQKKEDE